MWQYLDTSTIFTVATDLIGHHCCVIELARGLSHPCRKVWVFNDPTPKIDTLSQAAAPQLALALSHFERVVYEFAGDCLSGKMVLEITLVLLDRLAEVKHALAARLQLSLVCRARYADGSARFPRLHSVFADRSGDFPAEIVGYSIGHNEDDVARVTRHVGHGEISKVWVGPYCWAQ